MRLLFCANHWWRLEETTVPMNLDRLIVVLVDQVVDDVAMALLVDGPWMGLDLDLYFDSAPKRQRKLSLLQLSWRPALDSSNSSDLLDKYVALDPSIDTDPDKDQVVKAILVVLADNATIPPLMKAGEFQLSISAAVGACVDAARPSAMPTTDGSADRQLSSSSRRHHSSVALPSPECRSRHFEAVIGLGLLWSCR